MEFLLIPINLRVSGNVPMDMNGRQKLIIGQGARVCKECAKGKQSSFPEQAIYYYLKQLYPNVFNSYKIDGYEADVFFLKIIK